MKPVRWLAGMWLLLICPMMISCSIAPELTRKEKETFNQPVIPHSRTSPFKSAISNLGVMIDVYGFPRKVIQGKFITNKTACKNLPIDITDMIKTAVNDIGDRITYVVYDPSYEMHKHGNFYDHYGYSGLAPAKGQLVPEIVLEGAITECDENLDIKSSNIDAFGMVGGGKSESDIDAGMSKGESYSRLALDLHIMDYQTNRLIPKKQTSMAVNVNTLEKGRSFGFMIYGSGIGVDGQRRVVQGKHNAVRSLVELSTLQLIGRYLEIPYWRCIPGGKEDPAVINMLHKDFQSLDPSAKLATVQYLLGKYGYPVRATKRLDQVTRAAMQDFRQHHGGSATVDANLYVDLMLNMPMPFDQNPQTYALPSTQPQEAEPEPPTSTQGKPLAIQANFVYRSQGRGPLKQLSSGDALYSGDHYKIQVRANQRCYIYIFQADSADQFFQLFPLRRFKGAALENTNPVVAMKPYTLPAADKAFVLDDQTGTERIYLVASLERSPELERLYNEILSNRNSFRSRSKMERHMATKRGVTGVPTGQPARIPWRETGDIFTIMSQRLDQMSKDCVYVLEFNHRQTM
jgi:hypothetical protein